MSDWGTMVLRGFALPKITEPDPHEEAESGLDPLGLSALADRLADELTSPHLTARMRRVRFLTAVAAASVVCERLWDLPSVDGTPPYLAFEWLLVQALAAPDLPHYATLSVPGIGKARAAKVTGGLLDGPSYLKVPTVFGFHGVYRRLARGVGIIDSGFLLGSAGDRLLRAWEADDPQRREGFTDRRGDTPGGDFNRSLQAAVARALQAGGIAESPQSHIWTKLARAFRPDEPGPREREVLWRLLLDVAPAQTEILKYLDERGPGLAGEYELDVLTDVRPLCSPDLRCRIDAVLAYEELSAALYRPFQAVQWAATLKGTSSLAPPEIGSLPALVAAASVLRKRADRACVALDPLGLAAELESLLTETMVAHDAADLWDKLLARHGKVQQERMKRPWFDVLSDGVVLRAPYRLDAEPPDLSDVQVHPFRIRSLAEFRDDLKGRV